VTCVVKNQTEVQSINRNTEINYNTTHPHCPRQGADISLACQGGIDIRHQVDVYHDVLDMWNFHAERQPPPWDI